LFIALEKVKSNPPDILGLPKDVLTAPIVLITDHRKENFGKGFETICKAISRLAKLFENVQFVYPVHLNPNVSSPVYRILKNIPNVHLIQPLPYLSFVSLMNHSILILTDSGGIQEEALSLGKPVLVMREVTERPEAVQAGTAKLVGTDFNSIVEKTSKLLTERNTYDKMALSHNPYGDGKAAYRIIDECSIFLY
ncbi:UDP-N-acetylglucosamine 2-epimerase (non-hydrolyzing), partial [Desulfobacteraceae bacterium SEEP-SAG9]